MNRPTQRTIEKRLDDLEADSPAEGTWGTDSWLAALNRAETYNQKQNENHNQNPNPNLNSNHRGDIEEDLSE